jgi:hypothetical protein
MNCNYTIIEDDRICPIYSFGKWLLLDSATIHHHPLLYLLDHVRFSLDDYCVAVTSHKPDPTVSFLF